MHLESDPDIKLSYTWPPEGAMNVSRLRIAIVLNSSWNIFNFRLGLMERLRKEGYELVAVAPRDSYSGRIPFPFYDLPMSPRGRNPFDDLRLVWRIMKIYVKLRPDVVLHFTPKPNIYGSLAAMLLGIPSISNVAGLGTVFTSNDWLKRCVELLYRFALRRNQRVFFQNTEDMEYFIGKRIVKSLQAARIPGSGIDLEKFKPNIEIHGHGVFRFLLVSRLLWEKGVDDFIESSRKLNSRGTVARFQLLGFIDDKDPASVSSKQVAEWVLEGCVEYLGVSDDVRCEMAQADCIVLPSRYREGVPRVLLEAAAMGKPIIAYRNAGICDVVDDGKTGYLVPMREVNRLVESMQRMVTMNPQDRRKMGELGRAKMESEFGESQIASKYLEVLAGIGRNGEIKE